jgi:hypothetical protein
MVYIVESCQEERGSKQAVEMIGSALVEEIWAILYDHKPFDRARFTELLEQLG